MPSTPTQTSGDVIVVLEDEQNIGASTAAQSAAARAFNAFRSTPARIVSGLKRQGEELHSLSESDAMALEQGENANGAKKQVFHMAGTQVVA